MSNNSDKIDDIDRKILSLIQEDSRMTMVEIARAVGKISKVAVSYRLKKLEDRGIIERYYAKLNPEKLNRILAYFKGSLQRKRQERGHGIQTDSPTSWRSICLRNFWGL